MFDDQGEAVLRTTDLDERLSAALDGPQAWLNWDIARAIARNLLYKLHTPPQKPQRVLGYQRLVQDLRNAYDAWPDLTRMLHATQDGMRMDDPEVCSRHECDQEMML